MLIPTAAAASGDISLSSMSFSTERILEGQSVRIWASALNNSPYDLLGSIRFSNQFGIINVDQPISALAGNTDDVFVDWFPPSSGYYTITTTVIPWDPTDDDISNNVIAKQIFVEADMDHDGIPDDEDDDRDGDGVSNDDDAFPDDSGESEDTDGDGIGNNADDDDDNDGVLDDDDAFPDDPYHHSDQDDDGIPDDEDDDRDGDGLSNDDEDKADTDPDNPDTDGDGYLDGHDPFPTNPSEWQDTDGDGQGDNSDPDIDGDLVDNDSDSDPYNSSPSADTDKEVYLTNIGDEVIFDASASSDDGSIINYIWDFDGEILDGPVITRNFDAKGLQTATLTVYDENGQSDTTEFKVRVLNLRFIIWALLFALTLISLAYYLIYRYNREARNKKPAKKATAKAKKTSKKIKKKK